MTIRDPSSLQPGTRIRHRYTRNVVTLRKRTPGPPAGWLTDDNDSTPEPLADDGIADRWEIVTNQEAAP